VGALLLALPGCGQERADVSVDSVRDAVRLHYDIAANPFSQVDTASSTATNEDKHILLVAGGEWCVWCYYLEDFLAREPAVADSLHDTFVVVHVNFSDENRNEEFFGSLPEADGYPHFWILDKAGRLLESQGTLALEDGDKSYNTSAFLAFINRWRATLDR
jgi:hypothetical protein